MLHKWLRAQSALRLVFLAVMLLLASTLGWLGWHLLDQERELSVQRLTEQRETSAELAVVALEKRISNIEQVLGRKVAGSESAKDFQSGDGTVFIQFLPHSIRAWPENALVYYPELPDSFDSPNSLFDASDELESRKSDYAGAIAASRKLAESNPKDSYIQAASLVRIARNYRKNGQLQESLQAYAQLSALGSILVDGMPAALAGDAGVLRVSEDRKESVALTAAAGVLKRDLNAAKWPIPYEVYQSLSDKARPFLPETERGPAPQAALAEAVQSMWERWNRDKAIPASDRISMETSSGPVLFVWRISGNAMAGFAANTRYLESQWLAEMRPQLEAHQSHLVLTDSNGHELLGNKGSAGSRAAIRLAAKTGLPWTIQTSNTGVEDPAMISRRRVLVLGMGVLAALILTGSWFVGHAVAKELAVARLQTDFVSVVSHEFRTPLTTLCQLSELLKRDRVASDEDRRKYYDFLHHESHRLRRLVESLLDFGRLESGTMKFRFEDVDAADIVRQAVADYSQSQRNGSHRFEVETGPKASVVHADRETLGCVFWNLLENAAKYSPGCDTVRVELANDGKQVAVAITDSGVGIPRGEQRRIFEKFVRGAAASSSGIRGTGIGLATARQIVRAHGGDITLESEPGKGSTFRVVLPLGNGKRNGT